LVAILKVNITLNIKQLFKADNKFNRVNIFFSKDLQKRKKIFGSMTDCMGNIEKLEVYKVI